MADTDRTHIIDLHRNVQRLLKPVHVVNPFAEQLTFMDDRTRTRRDHMKYLTLIRAIALLHQFQREHKTVTHRGEALTYIEVTKADIVLANRIAHEVLGRTLDELPPQTRRLLKLIHAMVLERSQKEHVKPREVRFTRRDIREFTRWSDNQLKVHCMRLVEHEYMLAHGGHHGRLLTHELMYDGAADDESRLAGLIDAETLDNEERKLESGGRKLAQSWPVVGAKLGDGWGSQNTLKSLRDGAERESAAGNAANAVYREKNKKAECTRSDARIVEDAE